MARLVTISPTAEAALLVVSPRIFVVIWWLVQGLHAAFIVYSAHVVKLHRYFIINNLEVTIDFMGPTVYGYFNAVIVAHYILIVCHSAAMVQSVWWSLYYHQWRFVGNSKHRDALRKKTIPRAASDAGGGAKTNVGETTESSDVSIFRRFLQKGIHAMHEVGLAIFGRYGLLSVEGTYYESTFFATEVIEIALQAFQAYKLSLLVPRVWINRLNVVVLILNCWSTAFVHQFLNRDRLTKRVVLLVVDGVFDIVSSMVIPLVIIYPYYMEFDLAWQDFPLVDYYNDVWLLQAISENRQVFVTSWLDYVSKLTPGVTVFGGMLVLKHYLVMDRKSKAKQPSQGSASIAPSTQLKTGLSLGSDINIGIRQPEPSVRVLNVESPKEASKITHGQLLRKTWQHLLLFLTGLVILVIHIHSTTVAVLSNTRGCLLEVRPWLTTSYTCIALEINCASGEFDSGADVTALEEQGRAVVPSALKSLIFASCARLRIPPMLQNFSGLQMIKIYNSTVLQWDSTAELREDLHLDLQLLYICDSNFSGNGNVPEGLLGDNFPPTLVDVEFSGTNIVDFPANLHEKWTKMQYFVLERNAKVTEFPAPLLKMKIPQLYLGSNAIKTIPDDLLADQAFWALNLNGNPLQALPTLIGDFTLFSLLEASDTNISTLPSWATGAPSDPVLLAQGYVEIVASGAQVCEDFKKRENANKTKQAWVHFNCDRKMTTNYIYPIEEEHKWRAASLAKMG